MISNKTPSSNNHILKSTKITLLVSIITISASLYPIISNGNHSIYNSKKLLDG